MHKKLWLFNKKLYNFNNFINNHPGGKWVIEESKGHDITYLVQNNHNWTKEQAVNRLKKYEYKTNTNYNTILEWDIELDSIHDALKKKGFDHTNLKTPLWGWLYYLIYGITYSMYFYNWIVNGNYGIIVGLFGVIFGLIQHEASHSALSNNPWINYIFRYTLIPWASPENWYKRHSINHHQYTNTILDDDYITDNNYFVRHHKSTHWYYPQRIQTLTITLYSFFLTFFFSIGYVSIIQLLIISSHYYLHNNIVSALSPFMTFGFIFIIISQLNHIQNKTTPKQILYAPTNFVKHQIACCYDYSHGNHIITIITSFLNYQTYHHLFPNISHFHFLILKPIIDEILLNHGYEINHDSSFKNTIKKYFIHLNNLSKK
jgi:fatty acid desaturase